MTRNEFMGLVGADYVDEYDKTQLSQEGTTKDAISEQPDVPNTNVGDINKFIDGLEKMFADIRERHVDDSVCGLCEYDGAYVGQSGDWCNECPGFDKDDCFKLSDKTRKKWTEEIIKALPSVQPEERTKTHAETHACDLISRQAAVDAIIKDKICDDSLKIMIALGSGDKAETLNMTCDRHAKMLMSLPSAQPERKKGKWIPYDEQYECSECGVLWEFYEGSPEANNANYCPHCGADMRGETE